MVVAERRDASRRLELALAGARPPARSSSGAGLAYVDVHRSAAARRRRTAREAAPGLYDARLDKWRIDELYDATVIADGRRARRHRARRSTRAIVDGILARLSAAGRRRRWARVLRAFQTRRCARLRRLRWSSASRSSAGSSSSRTLTPRSSTASQRQTATTRSWPAPGIGYTYRWDADGDGKPDEPEFGQHDAQGPPRAGQTQKVRLEVTNAFGRTATKVVSLAGRRPHVSVGHSRCATAHRRPHGRRTRRAAPFGWPARGYLVSRSRAVAARSSPPLGPLIAAALVAVARPAQAGWDVQRRLAVIAGLLALFVVRRSGPDGRAPRGHRRRSRRTSGHLLDVLIVLPIAGAVAILFLPRQHARAAARRDAALMGVTFATIAARCSAVPMGRGCHFNQDVRLDAARSASATTSRSTGSRLWLVLLTVLITPDRGLRVVRPDPDADEGLVLRAPAPRGGDARRLRLARPLPLLRVLGADARPHVRDDRRLGRGRTASSAAIKFFLYTMFGSMLMLAAILYIAYPYARARPARCPRSTIFDAAAPRHSRGSVQVWLLRGVRAGVLHQGADVAGAHVAARRAHRGADGGLGHPRRGHAEDGDLRLPALLDGALPRGIASQCAATSPGVAVLGGILYGALCAWKQEDVKRLIAYSSVAHLGYVMLGLFARDPRVASRAAVLQMVNHGISTGALFLLFGVIYDRRHTRHGRRVRRPRQGDARLRALFVIATLASDRRSRARTASSASSWSSPGPSSPTRSATFSGIQARRRRDRRHPRRGLHAERRAEDVLRPDHATRRTRTSPTQRAARSSRSRRS